MDNLYTIKMLFKARALSARTSSGSALVNARAGTCFLRAKPRGCGRVRIQPLLVELPEQQRLAHVAHGHRINSLQVGDGARHAQDPAAGTRGQVEALRGELKQVAG